MASKKNDNDNGFRAFKLLIEGGGYLSKQILQQKATSDTIKTIDEFLAKTDVKRNISKLSILMRHQKDIIYPRNGTPTNLDDWDITLVTMILRKCFKLSQLEEQAVQDIRGLRNMLVGHTVKVGMTDTEFKQNWETMSSTLTKHAELLLDPKCRQFIQDLIDTILTETLSAEMTREQKEAMDKETEATRTAKEEDEPRLEQENRRQQDDVMLTKAYTDVIKDGIEESKTIRLMVVGNGKVGKSSLTGHLIGNPQIEYMSTDGINVHTCTSSKSSGSWSKHEGTATDYETERLARIIIHRTKTERALISENNSTDEDNVIKPQTLSITQLRQIRAAQELKDDAQEQRFVKVWDIGSQFIDYATHQLFHSRHAVYLLVLDASMKLDDMVKEIQYPGQTTTKTVKHYCQFLMHSIHSYVGSENGDAPPVILVATHIDAVEGGWNIEKENDFFESVREIFDDTILANHIQPISFALSNTKPSSKEFELLRNYIVEVADKQQSKNRICQPARWIALETSITEHIDQRHISLDELRRFDLENELPIKKHDQLLAFLKLHHSLGDLVYFDDDDLSETIIIDPQWIIDAFKSIITSNIFCKTNVYLRPKWKELVEEAKLSNDLIDSVWNEEANQDFKDNKEKLLRYMSKLGILFKVCEVDIDTGNVPDCDFYMVPSLLHTQMPGDVLERVLKSSTGTTTALVFAFDSKFVFPTLYLRITAAAIGQWKSVVSNGTRLLYENIGVYELDPVHAGVIERRDDSIEIRVINRCKGDINYTHTDRLRRFVKLVIQKEYHRSGVSRAKLYTEHIRCNLNNVTGDKTIPSSELIKIEYKSIPCPDNSADHILDLHIVQKEWQLLNATKMEISCYGLANEERLEQMLTEREITKVAFALDRNWQDVGLSLGLTHLEIEQIELENQNDAHLQVVNVLTKWSEIEGKRATIAALIKHTSFLRVDWDVINNILDEKRQCYDTRCKKGMLLILNCNEKREGTHADADKLRLFFGDTLGFEIHDPRQQTLEDLTSDEAMECLKGARDLLSGDLSETYYCFICVILSNGNKGNIKTKDGKLNIEDEVCMYFGNTNLPKFAGRPKLFFVQSCRGKEKADAEVVDENDEATKQKEENMKDEPDVNIIKIPNEADTLMVNATTTGHTPHTTAIILVFGQKFRQRQLKQMLAGLKMDKTILSLSVCHAKAGNVAFRRTKGEQKPDETGSWFISECMKMFRKEWKTHHVEDMLITVRKRVAQDYSTHKQAKQMLCVWSTMSKRLYLAKDSTLNGRIARIPKPTQESDEKKDIRAMLLQYGRKSTQIAEACVYIGRQIKASSMAIKEVCPTYKPEAQNDITFIAYYESIKDIEMPTRHVDKGFDIKYQCVGQYENDISEVSAERKKYADQKDRDRLTNVLQKYSDVLMRNHSNLNSITASPVKSTGFATGKHQVYDELCIVFYVRTKGYIPIQEEELPSVLDHFKTDVREDEILLYNDPELNLQPLKIGCLIGRNGGKGTLGAFLINISSGKYGCITSSHPFLDGATLKNIKQKNKIKNFKSKDALKIYQWAPFAIEPPFGEMTSAVYKNDGGSETGVEACLITINDPDQFPGNGRFPKVAKGYTETNQLNVMSSKILQASPAEIAEYTFYKYGAITGRTMGWSYLHPSTMKFHNDHKGIVLNNQIVVYSSDRKPFAQPGDSGALVLIAKNKDLSDLQAFGILTGGNSKYGVQCYVTPIWEVLKALKLPQQLLDFNRHDLMETKDATEKTSLPSEMDALTRHVNELENKFENVAKTVQRLNENVGKMDENMTTIIQCNSRANIFSQCTLL